MDDRHGSTVPLPRSRRKLEDRRPRSDPRPEARPRPTCDPEGIDRLSALDSSFLALDTPAAPLHVGWTMRFGGTAPPLAQVRRHLDARLHLVPRFRRRVVRAALGAAHWEDAPGFTIDAHVHAISAPGPGDAGALRDVAGALLSSPLDPEMPLWRVFLVEGLQDGFALVGQAHHALVDGIAAMEVALLLFGPPPAAGELERWRPERARRGALPSPQHAVSGTTHVALELARGLRATRPGGLRDAVGAIEALTHRGPSTSLQANRTHHREVATAQASLEGVKVAGRRHGATINDVLLTASSLALGNALRRRGENPAGVKVLIPVNRRGAGAAGELGNRISLVTVELPTAERDPIRALRAVRDRTRAVKAAGADPLDKLSRAADHLPGFAQRQLARMTAAATDYAAVVSNVPGPPVELSVLGRPLTAMYPSVPVPAGRGLTIGCISYCGRLNVGLTADAEVVPDLLTIGRDLEAALDVLRVEAPLAPTPWKARAARRRAAAGALSPSRAAAEPARAVQAQPAASR